MEEEKRRNKGPRKDRGSQQSASCLGTTKTGTEEKINKEEKRRKRSNWYQENKDKKTQKPQS